jgi:ABC-type Fe3+-hydroxamate transport system substrate-binding protein
MMQDSLSDDIGQNFGLTDHYRRIVSLVPSLTETLFDLGAGERVIARTDYCIHPADQLVTIPSVGGPKSPDLTAILALQPDLILMDRDENRQADAQALMSAGAQVFVTYPQTVQATLDLLWDLAALLHLTTRAGPSIQTIARAYDRTRDVTASWPTVRVFCPIWRDPWMTFSAETYPNDLLCACGAKNILAKHSQRYAQITLDEVAERHPQLILLPNEPFAFSTADAADIHTHAGLSKIPIRHIDGTLLFWPGTRLAQALDQIPPLLADFRPAPAID